MSEKTMSDKGLIAEAREACEMKYFKGTYQAGLMELLTDALEARQPSGDDREVLIEVVKQNRSTLKRMSDGYPSVAFTSDEVIADAILAAGFSRLGKE